MGGEKDGRLRVIYKVRKKEEERGTSCPGNQMSMELLYNVRV
jgi:hypothetical protein